MTGFILFQEQRGLTEQDESVVSTVLQCIGEEIVKNCPRHQLKRFIPVMHTGFAGFVR